MGTVPEDNAVVEEEAEDSIKDALAGASGDWGTAADWVEETTAVTGPSDSVADVLEETCAESSV